jgi:hypothetical protein
VTLSFILIVCFVAGLASVLLHLLAIKVFPSLGLLDFPERYGLKRARLPYPTGIAVVLSGLGAVAALLLIIVPVTMESSTRYSCLAT